MRAVKENHKKEHVKETAPICVLTPHSKLTTRTKSRTSKPHFFRVSTMITIQKKLNVVVGPMPRNEEKNNLMTAQESLSGAA